MTATEEYVRVLVRLKPGELGLLRSHAGKVLDETVSGFDLFTGLWWPLRQRNERAPRREVAWLIAKLYAFRPLPQSQDTLACQIRRCQPNLLQQRERLGQAFDRMITLPLSEIEPALRWALDLLASRNFGVDWVKLTDDLSSWERQSTRLKWSEQYLEERGKQC
jgi:CRISPR type I-E-associated protein CasB/Cse2